MPEFTFTTEQTIVLDAIVAGASLTRAAAEAGVHRNTIGNWRRASIGFQLALCNAQYDRALLLREYAEELFQPAIDAIRDILADPKTSPSVRLRASLAIMNIATSQIPPQKKHPWQIEDTLLVPKRSRNVDPPAAHNLHNSAQSAQAQTNPGMLQRQSTTPSTGAGRTEKPSNAQAPIVLDTAFGRPSGRR
jgi:hypothetical protein